MLQRNIEQYIAILSTEAVKTARRNKLDTVSATHVEQASLYLISRTGRRLYRNMETIGAMTAGAALSVLISLPLVAELETLPAIVAALSIAPGIALLAYGIAQNG